MVNYPHKLKIKSKLAHPGSKTAVNFANRGMSFEKMINESNSYYLSMGLAVIHKKPTPIQIVKVDYPQRSRAKIVEAYFRPIILVSLRDIILTLKPRKHGKKQPCL